MATLTETLMRSMGSVPVWGYSPSFDILQTKNADFISSNCFNILLAGPGDIRHILHVLSRRRHTTPNASIRIYLYEKALETLARELLLLLIFLSTDIPMRQRCSLFLEVFGNTLVQNRTERIIEELSSSLLDLAYNDAGPLSGLVDLSQLKMRSLDDMIDIFKSWNHKVAFDVKQLREHRLRHYYQLRYDHRNNLIDWDYTMELKCIKTARVIHIKQYREWRNSGIAFEFGEQVYEAPNRTMASYTEVRKRNNDSVLCRGFWTDIVIGPYISFGVELCEESNEFAEQLFEVQNAGTGVEQNRHNTTELAVFNLLTLMHSIEWGKTYQMNKAHDIYSGIRQLEESQALTRNNTNYNPEPTKSNCEECKSNIRLQDMEALRNVKIIPITGPIDTLSRKKQYRSLFSHVFISTNQSQLLQDESHFKLTDLLQDKARVSIENSTFLLPLKKEQRALYTTRMIEMCDALGLRIDQNTKQAGLEHNDVLHFDYCRGSTS